MQLSNASQQGLMELTRFVTNTNTTTFSDIDLKAALNRYYRSFTNLIIEAMDGWDFNGDFATSDLVSGQQEYVFPSDILKIKRIEVTFDGTTWRKVRNLDINDKESSSDSTTVAQDFSENFPFADIMDNSVFLYPIPASNVTAGLKIWYEKDIDELADDTDEPNFLKDYHPGLAYGAAKEFLTKNISAEGNQQRYNMCSSRYKETIDSMQSFHRKRIQDEEYSLQGVYGNFDYGNE